MGKDAESKTILAVQSNMKKIEKITNKMWANAHKAPMYSRRLTNANGKRTVTRTKRLIAPHSIKIMVAGSAMQCVARHRNEMVKYGIKPQKESRSQPFMPSMSPGAKMMFEQFMCAYTQEGMIKAKTILESAKQHKRMRPEVVEGGFAQANASIFFSAAPVPMRTIVTPLKKAKKGAATKSTLLDSGSPEVEDDDPVAVEEDNAGGEEEDA